MQEHASSNRESTACVCMSGMSLTYIHAQLPENPPSHLRVKAVRAYLYLGCMCSSPSHLMCLCTCVKI